MGVFVFMGKKCTNHPSFFFVKWQTKLEQRKKKKNKSLKNILFSFFIFFKNQLLPHPRTHCHGGLSGAYPLLH